MEKNEFEETTKLNETNRLKINLEDDNFDTLEGTRINDKAPQFIAKTTMGDIKLSDYKGKWLILFSHPR